MQPDMARRLMRLQQQSARLSRTARALAEAAPRRSEGADASGCVTVVLGPDGLPREIRVRAGWEQRLTAGGLGGAVLDANTAAVAGGMRAWSGRLEQGSWRGERAAPDGDRTAPAADPPEPPTGAPRDTADLAEDVIAALQSVRAAPAPEPVTAEGRSGDHVTVRLGRSGLASCVISPRWATGRDGAAVTAALDAALRQARANLVASPPRRDLDALIGDALATLQSITDTPPAGGHDR